MGASEAQNPGSRNKKPLTNPNLVTQNARGGRVGHKTKRAIQGTLDDVVGEFMARIMCVSQSENQALH